MTENQKMKHESVKIRDGVEKNTEPEKKELESYTGQVIPNSAMLSMVGDPEANGDPEPDPTGDAPQNVIRREPSISALRAGTASPTGAQLGHPLKLETAVRTKMENAFGANLSTLKLYESEAAGAADASAVAQGNRIAFAPGKTDFHSRSGQELLGHEISHVMSQTRDGVRGRGLLENRALEARADREGAMAAAGESVFSGPVTGALSSAGPSAAVAGPMQAKKDENKKQASKMAKLAQKSRTKGLSNRERIKYDRLIENNMSDPKMMRAIFDKRSEKRQKEMNKYRTPAEKARAWGWRKYSSQDRYQYLLDDIRQKAESSSVYEKRNYRKAKRIALQGGMVYEGNGTNTYLTGLEETPEYLATKQSWLQGGWRTPPEEERPAENVIPEPEKAAENLIAEPEKDLIPEVDKVPEKAPEIAPVDDEEEPAFTKNSVWEELSPEDLTWLREKYQNRSEKPEERKGAKRPWELTREELEANRFNPENAPELAEIQKKIQNAGSAKEAYRIFAEFAEIDDPAMKTEEGEDWDLDQEENFDDQLFKDRLKTMTRQIQDYPELKGRIGTLTRINPKDPSMMLKVDDNYNAREDRPKGGKLRANLHYNPGLSRKDAETADYYKRLEKSRQRGGHATNGIVMANHELGHMLNRFVLLKNKNSGNEKLHDEDMAFGRTAGHMIDEVYKNRSGYSQEELEKAGPLVEHIKGHKTTQIKTVANENLNATSRYGTKNSKEFFAEAFGDVYQNGREARRTSIELVRLYEDMMELLEKKNKKAL